MEALRIALKDILRKYGFEIMRLNDSALVEQCIKGRIQVCNRSLNERDV
jgi:hypothetical protein